MTLALIVLIVFLVVWFFDSAKKKEDILTRKKKTITNVKLQDELYIKNFKLIISDLEKIASTTNLSGGILLDAIESLYIKYDIPDERTPEQKIKDRNEYIKDIAEYQKSGYYPADDSTLPLAKKIWHFPFTAPHLDRLELMLGTPDTIVNVDGVTYQYDFRGIPSRMYSTVPAKLINKINVLLTVRDLRFAGFNYSWNRQESLWQQTDKQIKELEENKKRYPWLYGDIKTKKNNPTKEDSDIVNLFVTLLFTGWAIVFFIMAIVFTITGDSKDNLTALWIFTAISAILSSIMIYALVYEKKEKKDKKDKSKPNDDSETPL